MQCASTSTYPENLWSGGLLPAELGGRVCLFVCLVFCLSVTLRCQAQKVQTVRIRIELGGNGHKPRGQFQLSFSFSFSFQFQFYNKRRHILLQRQQTIEPFQFSFVLTLNISSKHYMGPTPVYGARAEKPLQNADFAMKQTNICRLTYILLLLGQNGGFSALAP